MNLLVAVVQDQDAGPVCDALVAEEYRVTRINTHGGFLKRGNATLLIGAEAEDTDSIVDIIRKHAQTRQADDEEVSVGAGTIFVLPVRRYARM